MCRVSRVERGAERAERRVGNLIGGQPEPMRVEAGAAEQGGDRRR